MNKQKRIQMQRWYFTAFFIGESYIHVPIGTSEDDVRALLDKKYYGGNWLRTSLKKGKKYKIPRLDIE